MEVRGTSGSVGFGAVSVLSGESEGGGVEGWPFWSCGEAMVEDVVVSAGPFVTASPIGRASG